MRLPLSDKGNSAGSPITQTNIKMKMNGNDNELSAVTVPVSQTDDGESQQQKENNRCNENLHVDTITYNQLKENKLPHSKKADKDVIKQNQNADDANHTENKVSVQNRSSKTTTPKAKMNEITEDDGKKYNPLGTPSNKSGNKSYVAKKSGASTSSHGENSSDKSGKPTSISTSASRMKKKRNPNSAKKRVTNGSETITTESVMTEDSVTMSIPETVPFPSTPNTAGSSTALAALKKNPKDAASPRRWTKRNTNSHSNSNTPGSQSLVSTPKFVYDGPVVMMSGAASAIDGLGTVEALQLDTESIQSNKDSNSSNNVEAHQNQHSNFSIDMFTSQGQSSLFTHKNEKGSFSLSQQNMFAISTTGSVSSKSTNVSRQSKKSNYTRASEAATHYTMNGINKDELEMKPNFDLNNGFLSANSPAQEEQLLFEQRLVKDQFGIAVKKISSSGKAQLRYVKCVTVRATKKRVLPSDRSEKSLTRGRAKKNSNMSRSVQSTNSHRPMLPLNNSSLPTRQSSAMSVSSLMGRMVRRGSSTRKNMDESVNKDDSTRGDANAKTSNISELSISDNNVPNSNPYIKALTWGNKRKVTMPLHKFIAVRLGKTTDRTKKNESTSSRLLSLITSDKRNASLDIEAPTKVDRDKFAKAFSIFLRVPLDESGENTSDVRTAAKSVATAPIQTNGSSAVKKGRILSNPNDGRLSAAHSAPGDTNITPSSLKSTKFTNNTFTTPLSSDKNNLSSLLPSMTPSPSGSKDDVHLFLNPDESYISALDGRKAPITSTPGSKTANSHELLVNNNVVATNSGIEHENKQSSVINDIQKDVSKIETEKTEDLPSNKNNNLNEALKEKAPTNKDADDGTDVSSLTQGFDQEIVEELHQALTELRAELDASRAEAARAVKVAEQAIQSAESCSSKDWNSTVTHKAAEAAAQAQKRSAEAMAKQRIAEERLESERKSAAFWRKQAEAAEEESGALQTRAVAAEVQRAEIAEELDNEKQRTTKYIQSLKKDFSLSEKIKRESLASMAQQNRLLEIELDGTRRDLAQKGEETKSLHDSLFEIKSNSNDGSKGSHKKKKFGAWSKKTRGQLLLDSPRDSTSGHYNDVSNMLSDFGSSEQLLKIQAEAGAMRKQFDLLRRTTADELSNLPAQAKEWANNTARVLASSQTEVKDLKNCLSREMACRRKLLNELQDLRGNVRVYCRPRQSFSPSDPEGIISLPTNEIALIHRDKVIEKDPSKPPILPLSFEFDRVFGSDTSQREIYSEMEELVLSSLDGYNVCLMSYGQSKSGKTYSLIGDFHCSENSDVNESPKVEIASSGMHLLAARQLLAVSKNRSGRFQDSFTLSIVEIHKEKIFDLLSGTDIAASNGFVESLDGKNMKIPYTSLDDGENNSSQFGESGSKPKKLEIRTNVDGDTIVQGLITVPINNYNDVVRLWKQSLTLRASRFEDSGMNTSSSHIIATIKVTSTNIATGIRNVGKINFVDLAASDVTPRKSTSIKQKSTPTDDLLSPIGNNNEWRFVHKSIGALAEVVTARSKFDRSVPYRNSTLTHLLRDSLEGDAKVLLLLCVSSDGKDLQETVNAMRFATRMRKVIVGKATKHTIQTS